jgi:hypothetical protein
MIRNTKSTWRRLFVILAFIMSSTILSDSATAQNARAALETYEEGPVWQIMTFRVPPANRETHLKNLATVWEHQAKLAQEMGFLVDYKILTKWPANPDDWNIMMIEIFPDMASYDDFWENWAAVDAETQYAEEFAERMEALVPTGSDWLGTVFAREVFLIDPFAVKQPGNGGE